jgi:hypothetical protein
MTKAIKQATLALLALGLALGACSANNTAATTANMSSEEVGWLTEEPGSTPQDEAPACTRGLCKIFFQGRCCPGLCCGNGGWHECGAC